LNAAFRYDKCHRLVLAFISTKEISLYSEWRRASPSFSIVLSVIAKRIGGHGRLHDVVIEEQSTRIISCSARTDQEGHEIVFARVSQSCQDGNRPSLALPRITPSCNATGTPGK
jgi:hypothetical protein